MNTIDASIHIKLQQATSDHFYNGHQILFGSIYYVYRPNEWNHIEGPYALKESFVYDGHFKPLLEAGFVWIPVDLEERPDYIALLELSYK